MKICEEDPAKPNINTIPKQRNSNSQKNLSISKINSVANLPGIDPHYSNPISPPKPVIPVKNNLHQVESASPRLASSSSTSRPAFETTNKQITSNASPFIEPIAVVSKQPYIEAVNKQVIPTTRQMVQPIAVSSKETSTEAVNKPIPVLAKTVTSSSNYPSFPTKTNIPMSAIPTEPESTSVRNIMQPPVRVHSPKVNQKMRNEVTKARSPILKPTRPQAPRYISSSSSDSDTPPPRPASPVFHVPSSQSRVTGASSSRGGNVSNVNRNSKSYDLDNLADLVTARLTSNSRQDLEQTHHAPSHQARSRPFTPHGHDQDLSRSRSRMSQFGFIDSRSTTPQLSKQNSFNNFGMFSPNTRNSFENNYNRNRHSADYMDDSDYGAYPLNRDFVRTPSVMDERALSSLGSTSYFDDNDYSAFTPDLHNHRKMSFSSSVCSTPLQTPKLNRDFGFVSSKKQDPMPKPPRRRSKDPNNPSRPVSRQHHSTSRETTPVNNPVKSPVRPTRLRPKNYSVNQQQNNNKKCKSNNSKSNNKVNHRPRSLQETSQEPIYEILTPVSNTFHTPKNHKYCSSSESESDFRTPQASPRVLRQNAKNRQKNINQSSIYEDIEIGSQSYQNFFDNPLVNGNGKKRSSHISTEEPTNLHSSRPKMIPPRTSQDPIPTPRQSRSLTRSRDQSIESLHSLNTLPKKLNPKKEPHYKVPPPNPRPVTPNETHLYSELLYEDQDQKNTNKKHKEAVRSNSTISDKIGQNKQKEVSKLSVRNQSSRKQEEERSVEKKQKLPSRRRSSESGGSSSHSSLSKHKQRSCRNIDLENNSRQFADANVKVELTGEDDKFYDATEGCDEVMVKKSKAIATLPDGSKYPCVIVQKKSKTDSNSRRTSSENITENKQSKSVPSTVPKKAPRNFRNYTPVEMKMKPDWFEDLKIKEETKSPRPTSIIDGVLYTSRALIEQETQNKHKKLNTFNLIEQDVFETYDVCKNYKEYEKASKVTT